MHFGNNCLMEMNLPLKRLREEAGLSLIQLGEAADLSPVTIWRIEKGERSPRLETLRSIANALKVEIGELVR